MMGPAFGQAVFAAREAKRVKVKSNGDDQSCDAGDRAMRPGGRVGSPNRSAEVLVRRALPGA